jgi:hypothetical protein
MRLVSLVVAATLMAGPAAAQNGDPSPKTATPAGVEEAVQLDLPVSLERIRDTLARLPPIPALRGLDRKPDFSVSIEERQRLEELFRSLEYKLGPAVPGGLYAYEQQRLLFNKTDHPLEQPYAAFSGGELITLAIEGLIQQYVGSRLVNAVSKAERARTERAARQEVTRAIAEFCSQQPDRNQIEICWMGTGDR